MFFQHEDSKKARQFYIVLRELLQCLDFFPNIFGIQRSYMDINVDISIVKLFGYYNKIYN